MPIKSEFPQVPIDERPFPVQFMEKIWLNGSNNPDKPALINAHNQEDRVTFQQVYFHIQTLATFLHSRGFGYKDVSCIISQNCWEYVVVFGASILCGGSLSGASYLFTEFEIRRQLLDNGASVVFCVDTLLEKVQKAILNCPKVKVIVVIGTGSNSTNSTNSSYKTCTQKDVFSFADALKTESTFNSKVKYNVRKDTLIIPYSSGTTGIPKGRVQLTHYNVSATIAAIQIYYDKNIWPKIVHGNESKNEVLLMVMPFYHIYGQSLLLYGLMAGQTSVIMKSFEPELFLSAIEKYKVKLLKAVPPMILFLAKSPLVDKYDLSSVCMISSGAAPLGNDLCDEVQKRLPQVKYIVQGFGMSETSVATHLPYIGSKPNSATVGKLMPNMEMKIVDVKSGHEVKTGERGELCVKGPNVMLGYLNRPKETSEIIDKDGWLHTGDVGYVDGDNCMYIVDRLKELIKVKGYQVPPAEIEDLLLSHASIADCAVIGVPDQKTGESPKAFVVRRDESLTEREVFHYVAERLAYYKQLTGGVEFIAAIPRSLAGKILRKTSVKWNY